MNKAIQWLLQADPWVEYRTRLDLLGQAECDPLVSESRRNMLRHPKIVTLCQEFSDWSTEVVTNHKNAGLLLHKLVFLADIGLRFDDPGIASMTDTIMSYADERHIPQVRVNIPVHFGGTGNECWGWALCDAPSILYALAKLGLESHPDVIFAAETLAGLSRSNGWPCAVSSDLGKFRGPGRKDDPCPYATLLMLKVLSAIPTLQEHPSIEDGAETLLHLWEVSRERHPYLFYMGTDFRKPKAPLVWYDIVHVADVLTNLEKWKDDVRLRDMTSTLVQQADENGHVIPQSEWKAWKGFEFSQKKEPSPWLSFLVARIRKRMEA